MDKTKKDTPVQIRWNEYARGFYCPSCVTGTSANAKKCKHCGQILLPYLEKGSEQLAKHGIIELEKEEISDEE